MGEWPGCESGQVARVTRLVRVEKVARVERTGDLRGAKLGWWGERDAEGRKNAKVTRARM